MAQFYHKTKVCTESEMSLHVHINEVFISLQASEVTMFSGMELEV